MNASSQSLQPVYSCLSADSLLSSFASPSLLYNPAGVIKTGMRLGIRSAVGCYYASISSASSNTNQITSSSSTERTSFAATSSSSFSSESPWLFSFPPPPPSSRQDSINRRKYVPTTSAISGDTSNRGGKGNETSSSFSSSYFVSKGAECYSKSKIVSVSDNHPFRVGAPSEFTVVNAANPFSRTLIYDGQEVLIVHALSLDDENLFFPEQVTTTNSYAMPTTSTTATLSSTPRSWSRLSSQTEETKKDKNNRGAGGTTTSFLTLSVPAVLQNTTFLLLATSEIAFSEGGGHTISVESCKLYNHKHFSAVRNNVRWIISKKKEGSNNNSNSMISKDEVTDCQNAPLTICDTILLKNVRSSSYLSLQVEPKKEIVLLDTQIFSGSSFPDAGIGLSQKSNDKLSSLWRLVKAGIPVPFVGDPVFPPLLQCVNTIEHVMKFFLSNSRKQGGKLDVLADDLAKIVGNDSVVMRNLETQWHYMPRQIREQMLLEDILYCYIGVEGNLVKMVEYSPPLPSARSCLNSFFSDMSSHMLDMPNEQLVAQSGPSGSFLSVSSIPGVDMALAKTYQHNDYNCLPDYKTVFHPLLKQSDEKSDSLTKTDASSPFPLNITKTVSVYENDDKSLCDLVEDLMKLCAHHRTVCRFVELHSSESSGTVSQALCAVIRKLLKEFIFRVAQLETFLREGALTLQKMRVYVQPIKATFSLLNRLARRVFGKTGGQILNGIDATMKQLAYGDPCRQLCEIFMQEASAPLCHMLEMWVYRGKIDDPYKEFFIQEDAHILPCGGGTHSVRGDDSSLSSYYNNSISYKIDDSIDMLDAEMRLLQLNLNTYQCCDNAIASPVYFMKGIEEEEAASKSSLVGTSVSPRFQKKKFYSSSNSASSSAYLNLQNSYWSLRFRLIEDMLPDFLTPVREQILHTGKYLNVLTSCDENSPVFQKIKEVPIRYSTNERAYLETLENAYLCSSKFLVKYFIMDLDLKDHADVELEKQNAFIGQLESLLDLSIRTSSTSSDPYKDDISIVLHEMSNISEAAALLDKDDYFVNLGGSSGADGLPRGLSGLLDNPPISSRKTSSSSSLPPTSSSASSSALVGEAYKRFVLQFVPKWPLNLIFTRRAIYKYQLVFRLLNQFKFVERKLHCVWQDHMFTKELFALSEAGEQLLLVLRTREEMLHFCRNFVYYATIEVIEPHFMALFSALDSATTFDDMLALHETFLSNILTECLLTDGKLLGALCKVLSICTIFARHVLKFSLDHQETHHEDDQASGVGEGALPSDMDSETNNVSLGYCDSDSMSRRGVKGGRYAGSAPAMSALNRRKNRLEAMRTHLECILNDRGFSGMVNSAAKQFHEKLYQFLELLVLHSRSKVDHHAVHLLTRLNFNNFYVNIINAEGI